MKNVLIPICVRLNHFTDDAVTVGLLAFNESVKFYDFSYDKLGIAKSVLDRNSGSYLENALKSMKIRFLEKNNKNEIAFPNKILSEKYIDYLSKYSNGIVKIGEPKGFDLVDFGRMDITIKKIESGDYSKFSESKLAIG